MLHPAAFSLRRPFFDFEYTRDLPIRVWTRSFVCRIIVLINLRERRSYLLFFSLSVLSLYQEFLKHDGSIKSSFLMYRLLYINILESLYTEKNLVELTGILMENERCKILVKSTRFLVKSIKILVEVINIQKFLGKIIKILVDLIRIF